MIDAILMIRRLDADGSYQFNFVSECFVFEPQAMYSAMMSMQNSSSFFTSLCLIHCSKGAT
jgi:hypothetical protein